MKKIKKNKSTSMRKNAQEEMVGFALIVIIVAVIILIFIGLSIKKPQREAIENYEVENFIQVFLQYTSDCKNNLEYLSIQKLIAGCTENEKCTNEEYMCEVLEKTSREIVNENWKVGKERTSKGYNLNISSGENTLVFITEGNITEDYKGGIQALGRNDAKVIFTVYY